jgi:hypothetical protein
MTTGRINQVTILSRGTQRPLGKPPVNGRQSCTVVGGRRSDPQHQRSPELGYNRFPQAIQLPPLCSPRDGPRYGCSGARRFHRVSHATLRRRIPSAGHARGGYQPGLTPKCLVNNDSHRPVIHRLHRYPRLPPRDFQGTIREFRALAGTSPLASGALTPARTDRDSAFTHHQRARGRRSYN